MRTHFMGNYHTSMGISRIPPQGEMVSQRPPLPASKLWGLRRVYTHSIGMNPPHTATAGRQPIQTDDPLLSREILYTLLALERFGFTSPQEAQLGLRDDNGRED